MQQIVQGTLTEPPADYWALLTRAAAVETEAHRRAPTVEDGECGLHVAVEAL